MQFTGWRKPISMSGAGKAVGVILRRRPCFFAQRSARCRQVRAVALSRAVLTRRPGDHSDATTMTARLDLLEFPKHPHKGGAQTDDDTQEQQSKSGSCEHGEHPSKEANGVNSERAEMIATMVYYTKVVASSPVWRFLFLTALGQPRCAAAWRLAIPYIRAQALPLFPGRNKLHWQLFNRGPAAMQKQAGRCAN